MRVRMGGRFALPSASCSALRALRSLGNISSFGSVAGLRYHPIGGGTGRQVASQRVNQPTASSATRSKAPGSSNR
jgi:hypothetical protein